MVPELRQKLNKTEANLEVVQQKSGELSVELNKAEDQHHSDEVWIDKLRKEKKELLEGIAKAERDIRAAEVARDKAEDQISSLKDSENTLKDKNNKLDSDLLSAQDRIKELENELNRRMAEPELKTYNIDVVESAPVVESGPPGGFDFFVDDESETLRIKVGQLNSKVEELNGKYWRFT